jgi:enoyl-CoA hydratase/carnithine racemase
MTDYNYDFVKVRVRDGIAWTALNRPEKRNAMSRCTTRWMTRSRGSKSTTRSRLSW